MNWLFDRFRIILQSGKRTIAYRIYHSGRSLGLAGIVGMIWFLVYNIIIGKYLQNHRRRKMEFVPKKLLVE
jgi:uncharacterized membrane protein